MEKHLTDSGVGPIPISTEDPRIWQVALKLEISTLQDAIHLEARSSPEQPQEETCNPGLDLGEYDAHHRLDEQAGERVYPGPSNFLAPEYTSQLISNGRIKA